MIQLRLLGCVDLRDETGRSVDALLSRPKRLALLAYLALTARDGFQRKDKLLALFWPESDQSRARQALRQALYVLRRELGENAVLSRGDDAVALNGDVVATDVEAFLAALEGGKEEAAAELYRGGLLEGFHISGAPDFDQWLELERARLKRSCATAFERLAVNAELAGAPHVVARWRRDQVFLDPLDSRVVLLAAHAADRAGSAAEASRIIRDHEACLRRELDLPLPPEMTDFLATLSRGVTTKAAPTLAAAGPAQAMAPARRRTRHARRWWWTALAATSAVLVAGMVWSATDASGSRIHRLAVLPFVNLMNDPEQEYFVQGLHDALISELARRELGVISRTSVIQYRNTEKPVRVIARELGADALIEASLTRTADSVTIHMRLVDASTEQFLWSHSYAADLRSVLALNRDAARAITRTIRPGQTLEDEAQVANARPVNPEVYDAYLKGEFYLRRLSRSELENAMLYFQLALEKDSTYAPAYAGISAVWGVRRQRGYIPPREAIPKVNAAALKALQLDSTLAEAHFALATSRTWGEWDWQGGERAFRQAIRLKPDDPQARASYAQLLCILGHRREAIGQIERARWLDPLDPQLQWLHGAVLTLVHRYDDAIAQYRETLRRSPRNEPAQWLLWLALHFKREYAAALAEAQNWADAAGDPQIAAALRGGYHQGGYAGAMRAAAETLVARSRTQYIGPWPVAIWYAAAGENDRALEWLEKAYDARDSGMPYLGVHPIWNELRDDPRYRDLLRRMKLRSSL